ncbi:hypothetical protein Vretimale_19430 [Volvox reticuliferus]|uniref:Protein DPCD n=1 Tax=Volvox reticuliferus TaxID=1737510 RepID=A0A8J4GWQ9_9CHLO|nr:hypothetical protein Vretifemale_20203 [Volvox reticuliferus]GIM16846.1 hypothetical protein Vretimale_19430 [Volvox reticuliferus]
MFREGGHTTASVTGNRRTVHTTWDDGSELVEEYDVTTGELLARKRRTKSALGALSPWEHLAGEKAPAAWSPDNGTLRESSLNPLFSRKDTHDCFQWRVRNLGYPPENYQVSIDHSDRKIVIRTANKKYYKRFNIPELDVLNLSLNDGALSWTHANSTLIISYAKPVAVLQAEAKEAEETRRLRAQQGDVECKQQ